MQLSGNLVDVKAEKIYPAVVDIKGKYITGVKKVDNAQKRYLLPGLIDAHIHLESTLLIPSRFGEAVVPHGTTAIIADPHEIANVAGLRGIHYLISDATATPLRVFYTAPPCVPASKLDKGNGKIDLEDIERLMMLESIVGLGEVMDYPAVLRDDKEILQKIRCAQRYNKSIDGHAPHLTKNDLKKYISYGISTDHECTNYEEAVEKLNAGLKIMIREGTCSKNLAILKELVEYDSMLVTDDIHPEELVKGHIDCIVKKGLALGVDIMKLLRCVTIQPASHYKLNIGCIEPSRYADIVTVDNMEKFDIKEVFIGGELVAKDYKFLKTVRSKVLPESYFQHQIWAPADFQIKPERKSDFCEIRLMQLQPNQIITSSRIAIVEVRNGKLEALEEEDILKIAVVNRYVNKKIVGKGFIKGFLLKGCAIASSVAHDSHKIVVVGTDDKLIASAVNTVIEKKGGFAVVSKNKTTVLPLSVAGLMSNENIKKVCEKLKVLQKHVQQCGCKLEHPFMTLSFQTLVVVPELKICDRGLVDTEKAKFVSLIKSYL